MHNEAQTSSSHKQVYDLREFRTIDQLVLEYPNLVNKNVLQWVLRFRSDNGLDQHVTKLGKHLLIHIPGFTSWLMKRGVKK
jgi:hypothetical protein